VVAGRYWQVCGISLSIAKKDTGDATMMNTTKKIMALLALTMLFAGITLAIESDGMHGSFEQAEALINAKATCSSLTDEQLELIGDYVMEQMHPGEAHEAMDAMMGGEGSERLRLVHINMARSYYCGDAQAMGTGMMYSGYGGNRVGMMGSAMMGQNYPAAGDSGYGMISQYGAYPGVQQGYSGMGSMMNGGSMMYGYSLWYPLLQLVYLALAALVFGAIFWWTYRLIAREKKRK